MLDQYGTSLIMQEIQPGERIVWLGQPIPLRVFNESDLYAIPFSILWLGMIYFIAGDLIRNIDFSISSLFPLLFIVIGLYNLFGRFIVKYLKMKNTYYALTNKRVIIISTFFNRHIQTGFITDLLAIDKKINSRGEGSLYFGNKEFLSDIKKNSPFELFNRREEIPFAFHSISNAEDVYRKITDIKNKV